MVRYCLYLIYISLALPVASSLHHDPVPLLPAGADGPPLHAPAQAVGLHWPGLDAQCLVHISGPELYRQVRCLAQYLSGEAENETSLRIFSFSCFRSRLWLLQ